MGRLIEYNRVYRRIEDQDRGNYNLFQTLPSIEINGSTTVSVYSSNLPRRLSNNDSDAYVSPISDSEILTKMTLTDPGLLPGFHNAWTRATWIAFIADDNMDPPTIYDSGLIDWEFDDRRKESGI